MKILAAVTCLAAFAGAASAQQPSAKGVNFYSLEKERELGRHLAARLQGDLPIVHEPKLDAYITQLGAGLARFADSPFSYTFQLYEDRGPRALAAASNPMPRSGLAMPLDALDGQVSEPIAVAGGAIFIPMSLLANAPNEAVFAFQLAHAMAHIAARHSTRLATKTEVMQMVSLTGENTPVALNQPALALLALARANERQADYQAVFIVSQGGYDPARIPEYLSSQPDQKQKAFLPYPTSSERAKAIRAEIEKLPATSYAAAIARFTEAKALAAAIR